MSLEFDDDVMSVASGFATANESDIVPDQVSDPEFLSPENGGCVLGCGRKKVTKWQFCEVHKRTAINVANDAKKETKNNTDAWDEFCRSGIAIGMKTLTILYL